MKLILLIAQWIIVSIQIVLMIILFKKKKDGTLTYELSHDITVANSICCGVVFLLMIIILLL